MKIIHCSDLHLDSQMQSNLSKEKAKERNNEILITFQNMVKYAKENLVKIIIIAGDLFDRKNISVKTKNIVKFAIEDNPEIDFIYLKGNHDNTRFIEDDEIPSNLKLFSKDEWIKYEYENNLVITGREIEGRNDIDIYNSLNLNKQDVNIVVMHGQESQTDIKDKTEIINLKELKNKNIDYLALGHIHSYKQEKLDKRGIYCYSGCLEGRGFDECGKKGFVLLNVENGKIESNFIEFAQREVCELHIDISDTVTTSEVESKISDKLKDIDQKNLVKIILEGKVDIESERDLNYLLKRFETDVYYLKIYDETTLKINYMDYKNDVSLKGEFIRMVLEQDLTDEEKKEIITTGIKALSGEEVD